MDEALRTEIDAIRADTTSGATRLVLQGIELLIRAEAAGVRTKAAELLADAQPAMAGFRTAVRVAATAADPAAALSALAARITRASDAIARQAADLLELDRRDGPLRIVTLSRSSVVERALQTLQTGRSIVVWCGEGRPALEGRDLAVALSRMGVSVELYSDAGLSSAIPQSSALVIGADAIGPRHFLNKVGTAAACALASTSGVNAYVLVGPEKFVSDELFPDLERCAGPAVEIWRDAPPAVGVQNPYFEPIPLHLVSGVITDRGAIGPDEVLKYELYTRI